MSTLTLESEHDAAPAASRSTWGFAHVPALDGLRGAAVAAVLLYHADYLPGGWLGVDLFFVLSGYLITSLLLAERQATDGIALKSFWIRRLRRLMPALLAMLCGVAVYAVIWARAIDLEQIRADGIATLFYVANWHTILQGTSYWDISKAPSPLQHTWSLAIEEQFYFVWPFVVYAIARTMRSRAAHVIGWVCLGMAAVSAMLFVGLHHVLAVTNGSQADNRVYMGTDTRATALLLGAAWAAWRTRVAVRVPRHVVEAIGVGAAIALGYAWINLEGTSRQVYRGGLPLCSVLAVLVVAAACERQSPVLGRVFAVKPLAWLGLISYGLYLWHWPVYLILDEQRVGHGGLTLLAVRLLASLAVALASFYVIERPIRHGQTARGRRGGFMVIGGMAVALAAILVSTRGAVDVSVAGTTPVGQVQTFLPGKPKMMFVGDSVAMSLVRGVVKDPKLFGVNPINETRPGCAVIVKGHKYTNFAGQPGTPPLCAPDPAQLVAKERPDVVFALVGARPNDYIQVDGKYVQACSPAFDRTYYDLTGEWLRGLGSSGAKVVLGTIASPGANALHMEGGAERTACVNRMIRRIAEDDPNVTLLDMNQLVCPNGKCIEEIDGDAIRTDGLHFDDGPGGVKVSQWVVKESLARTDVH
jgi:peptidoglycan/LPS O-acetylase OafA/YrhL